MWNKPYTLKEGTAIVIGLLITGQLLQFTMGPLEWAIFAWPANIETLLFLLIALVVVYALRKKVYFFRFMTTMQAAIHSRCCFTNVDHGCYEASSRREESSRPHRTNEDAELLAICTRLSLVNHHSG